MTAIEDMDPAAVEADLLEQDMIRWARGFKSHHDDFIALETGPADRQLTLLRVAMADAAEVQKLAAAVAALRGNLWPAPVDIMHGDENE